MEVTTRLPAIAGHCLPGARSLPAQRTGGAAAGAGPDLKVGWPRRLPEAVLSSRKEDRHGVMPVRGRGADDPGERLERADVPGKSVCVPVITGPVRCAAGRCPPRGQGCAFLTQRHRRKPAPRPGDWPLGQDGIDMSAGMAA